MVPVIFLGVLYMRFTVHDKIKYIKVRFTRQYKIGIPRNSCESCEQFRSLIDLILTNWNHLT